MRLSSKRPSLKTLAKDIGVDYKLAREYQQALGQVKATVGKFETMTRKKFGGKGMRFEIPQSIYQMKFGKHDNPNDYVASRLLELRQMQGFAGLAAFHSEQLDQYMKNVALAMGREGYSPAEVKAFLEKYRDAKRRDQEAYIKGKAPSFQAWEFVSLTGGADISMRYMSLSKYLEDDEMDMENDILQFREAIDAYIGEVIV